MRLLPYPRLWLGLLVAWLVLNGSAALSQVLLGAALATIACWSVVALEPPGSHPKRLPAILALTWLVASDIVRSNIAVIGLLLTGRPPRSVFVTIPLELRDRNGLTILACIVTATPGSTWVHYNSPHSRVIIHVLDTADEAAWVDTLKRTYEKRLQEIFE